MTEISLSLLSNIPSMVAWLIGVTLAIKMLRREGSKAERLLLIGCSLMLAEKFINPLLSGVVQSVMLEMIEQNTSRVVTAQTMGLIRLPLVVLTIVGLVCLLWAFWLKFWVKKREAV